MNQALMEKLAKKFGWSIAGADNPVYREGSNIYFPRVAPRQGDKPTVSSEAEEEPKESGDSGNRQ